MALQLSGYEPWLENKVFGRRIEDVLNFVLVDRYREPIEDDVIAYLRDKATTIGAAQIVSPTTGAVISSGNGLEKALEELPAPILRDMKAGDESLVRFIRSHTPARHLKEGEEARRYVRLQYGILGPKFVEQNQQGINQHGMRWFESAFYIPQIRAAGHGEQWHIRFTLHDGALPSQNAVTLLLGYGTYGCDLYDIDRKNFPRAEVLGSVERLYTGTRVLDDFSVLHDSTRDELEKAVIPVVMGLHEKVREGQVLQAVAQRVQEGGRHLGGGMPGMRGRDPNGGGFRQ